MARKRVGGVLHEVLVKQFGHLQVTALRRHLNRDAKAQQWLSCEARARSSEIQLLKIVRSMKGM